MSSFDVSVGGDVDGNFVVGSSSNSDYEEAIRLLEYALVIRQYGERPPGGDENWQQFDRDTERFLRRVNGFVA